MVAILVASINDILSSRLLINTPYITTYAFFVFLIAQAYILGYRSTVAFNEAEDLSVNLEKIVVQRTSELEEEKQKADSLLLNILPEETAREMKASGKSKARLYKNVSVLFVDIVNFTRMSEKLGPEELVHFIDKYFRHLDKVMARHGLEKIKTIGDAYLAVCGLPNEDEKHARKVVKAALEILEFIERTDAALKGRKVDIGLPDSGPDSLFRVKIGIHTGPVVAGVVGIKKFAYDIWGDTVNTAARMEQNAEPGQINISEATYALVKDDFTCHFRGELEAKNKGKLGMYYVDVKYRQETAPLTILQANADRLN
jgi:class 3 adenylate cyclase